MFTLGLVRRFSAVRALLQSSVKEGTPLNIQVFKAGKPAVALKDEEYPDWLWTLLDKEAQEAQLKATDEFRYMRKQAKKVHRQKLKQNNFLAQLRKRPHVPQPAGSAKDSPFSMQLLVMVVALGAGFAIGRTSTRQNPPRDLFPAGSTTTKADLCASTFNSPADYALFQRCVKKLQNELNLSSDDVDEELWRAITEKPSWGSVLWSHKDIDTAKMYRIRPKDAQQLAMVMKLCQLYRVPVQVGVPFDGYKKDQYGLTVDLGRMDRILAYNERTKTVTCECNADVGSFANSCGLSAMNTARPLDLALSWLGLTTPGCSVNGYPLESLKSAKVVLADGTTFTASRETLRILAPLGRQFATICEMEIALEPQTDECLVLFPTHNVDSLVELADHAKLPLTYVGNFGFAHCSLQTGESVGVFKMDRKQAGNLVKLAERLGEAHVVVPVCNLHPRTPSEVSPVTNSVAKLVVSEDFAQGRLTELGGAGVLLNEGLEWDAVRRLKLAIDPNKILNSSETPVTSSE
ncbi:hypothetical protein KL918_004670 [Ogataea parapolymorpha]|nr:hypothetical protein KL918_004670 [Ogataea parapolymorpha]KAG7873873.1 hypothetical protein KL916_002033 [Ogataea parapolymorpha]